ncbi:hypothetical protein C6503_24175 [Candidatus Poribacteria bacterium]|nr:MAG: hypothetical protein C6503_24175 [Candidatus Poribacteria bacterium]
MTGRVTEACGNPQCMSRRTAHDVLKKAFEAAGLNGHHCAVCGFNVTLGDRLIAIEAAHIKWHSAEGPDIPRNGMALCALHHKLFDRGVFTLSDQLAIKVSEQVDPASPGFEEWLGRFKGRDIYFPSEPYLPDAAYVQWYTKQVFKGESAAGQS